MKYLCLLKRYSSKALSLSLWCALRQRQRIRKSQRRFCATCCFRLSWKLTCDRALHSIDVASNKRRVFKQEIVTFHPKLVYFCSRRFQTHSRLISTILINIERGLTCPSLDILPTSVA